MKSAADNSNSPLDLETNPNLVRAELNRILASDIFSKAERMERFLRFVTESTLGGDASEIKEVVIGLNVFDRPPDYDPRADPVVRYEARRLRAKLDQYYSGPGARDAIRIELPKGGYVPRFVRTASNTAPILLPVEVHSIPEQRPPRILIWTIPVAALAIITIVWLLLRDTKKAPSTLLVQPVTDLAGEQQMPALDPSGKQLAFVWDGDSGNKDIYVTMFRDAAAKPLRLTTDATLDLAPAWSPDGSRIAFMRVSGLLRSYFIVPALGGAERLLLSDASSGADGRPVWLPDGKSLIVSHRDPGAEPCNCLLWITADGSQRRQVTFPRPNSKDYLAAISPSGREVAFVRQTGVEIADIYIQALDAREPRRLTTDGRAITGLTWAGPSELIFTSTRAGGSRLWKLSAAGGTPQLLLSGARHVQDAYYSPQTSRLLFTEIHTNTNIWRAPIDDRKLGKPQKLIASSSLNDSPQYSNDGRHIAFISDRSGWWEVWVADSDGSNAVQLTSFAGGLVGTPRWSPDGRELVFDSAQHGRPGVFRIAATGGQPKRVTADQIEGISPSWSADGKWIYFGASTGSEYQLWKQSTTGGAPVQVTSHGGIEGLETPDGKTLIFVKSRDPGIWSMPVAGGPETLLPSTDRILRSRYLAVTKEGVYYLGALVHDRTAKIYFLPKGSSDPQLLGILDRPSVWGKPSLTVAPDGSNIVYAQIDTSGSQVVMVEGIH